MSQKIDVIVVSVVPVLTNFGAGAYSSGDQLGAVNTITNACADTKGTVRIQSIVVVDIDKQNQPIDIFFFSDSPTLASADNAAFSLLDAQMFLKCRGVVQISAASYSDTATSSIACVSELELLVQAVARSRDIYCVAVARGTPTYSTISSLKISIGMIQ